LLHPPSEVLTLRLEPKPGLSDKQLKLVGGTLSLQPSPLPVGQGRAPPPRRLLHALGKSGAGAEPSDGDGGDVGGDAEVEVAWDPAAERARRDQDGEPRPPFPEAADAAEADARLAVPVAFAGGVSGLVGSADPRANPAVAEAAAAVATRAKAAAAHSLSERGAGQLMDAWLRGATGLENNIQRF
jgi:hypothetical protein